MGVTELSVANVSKAVSFVVVPSVPELRQPQESLRAVDLRMIRRQSGISVKCGLCAHSAMNVKHMGVYMYMI